MDIDGWEINVEALPGPQRHKWPAPYFSDEIYPNLSGGSAALVYSISEIRMMWYVGLLAIFQNRSDPVCILNPKDFLCFSAAGKTVSWLTDGLLALTKYSYQKSSNKLEVPFCLIDLDAQLFSFIPVANSFAYSVHLEGEDFRLKENHSDDRFPSADNELYTSEQLDWYPMDKLSDFDGLYFSRPA
jgi:hypothetical protein